MRGELDSLGSPTKHFSLMLPAAFFTAPDFDKVKPHIDHAIDLLTVQPKADHDVVFPAHSIGTGRG